MLSINNTRALTQNQSVQKIQPQQQAFNTQTMAQDTVSFNGGIEKAAALTKTKGGLIGLLGLIGLSIFGVASTAKAHDLYANNGRLLAHEHQIPGNQSTSLYVDSHGNWGIATSQNGGYTRNDPGDQEMMKVGPNRWQEVRRVFDENNNQKFIKYGAVIKRSFPIDPQPGFRIPPNVRNHFNNMENGQVIIITPGSGRHHNHHHHHNGRDRAIERSFRNW